MPKHPWTTVAIIGMLLGTAVALIWGVAARSSSDPAVINFVTIIISIIAAAIPGLIAAAKAEQVHEDIKNGVLKDKMKEAIVETVEDKNNDVKGFFMDPNRERGHMDALNVIVITAIAIVVVAIYALLFR
jgi:hypothetical protein